MIIGHNLNETLRIKLVRKSFIFRVHEVLTRDNPILVRHISLVGPRHLNANGVVPAAEVCGVADRNIPSVASPLADHGRSGSIRIA